VKNGWERQYCLSMDVALLSKSTQLSVMLSWYKLSKDFHVTEKLVEIYANEECEAEEPAHPFKREDKKLCIPSEDSQQIELPPFTAKAVNLVLRLVMTAGSDVIIKSFNLVDCSPEPDMSKKPTPKPSGKFKLLRIKNKLKITKILFLKLLFRLVGKRKSYQRPTLRNLLEARAKG